MEEIRKFVDEMITWAGVTGDFVPMLRHILLTITDVYKRQTQKSIQYMYEGTPTTQSGAFQMTTISLGSAFEGMGTAHSGYRSKTFEKFVNSLAGFRDRVDAQYAGTVYPTDVYKRQSRHSS